MVRKSYFRIVNIKPSPPQQKITGNVSAGGIYPDSTVFLSGHIKKIWEGDPLLCRDWDSLMKIISFIYERKVIKKILNHLGLYEEDKPKRNRAPPPSRDFVERIIESYGDGWSDYDEFFVDVQTLWLCGMERSCHKNMLRTYAWYQWVDVFWKIIMTRSAPGRSGVEQ